MASARDIRNLGSQITGINTRLRRESERISAGGAGLSDYYSKGIQSYDPDAAFRESVEGATSAADRSLGRALSRTAGRRSVDTGFYDLDVGDVIRENRANLYETIAGRALDTQGLRLRALEGAGSMGIARENLGAEMGAGVADRLQAERNALRQERAKKRKGWGSLLGGIVGGIAGIPLGNPLLGAQVGAGLGGAVA